jgi:thymidine kinase
MAKLYFRYSAMNSGKTTALIQAAYNYEERGMSVVIVKPAVDTKGGDTIVSRLGTTRRVDIMLGPDATFETEVAKLDRKTPPACVLIDEASLLSPDQIEELFWYAVNKNVPVLAFGLRTDFQTKGFPGASRLLEMAHEITELKTICRCGKKAIFNARKVDGQFTQVGNQVEIDDKSNVEYEALCANDYQKLVLKRDKA